MSTISTADFKKGIFIIFKDEPHQIIEFQHVNPGKGSAFVRTRLKSLKTGRVQEFTFKSGEMVTEYPVETHEMQYLYEDGSGYVFMDNFSYEQFTIKKDILTDYIGYMKPNDTYQILVSGDQAVGVRFPKKVRLLVTEADDGGAQGSTMSGATKAVKMETGITVQVPLFIKEGEMIAVDPETGQYIERA